MPLGDEDILARVLYIFCCLDLIKEQCCFMDRLLVLVRRVPGHMPGYVEHRIHAVQLFVELIRQKAYSLERELLDILQMGVEYPERSRSLSAPPNH